MSPQPQRKLDRGSLEPSWDLPRGRHRLPPELVAENQRGRLLAAVAQVLAERGYARFTVEDVIAVAGVSRKTFYDHFENKQEAVAVAHDVVFQRFLTTLLRACDSEREWPRKVKASIRATLEFAAVDPAQAQLLVLDALAADVEVTSRVLASNDHLASLLSAGRQHSPRGAELPPLTEKAIVGAVSGIVAGRLLNGEAEQLPELEHQLVEIVLMPYIGAEEAARLAEEAPA